MKIAAVTGGNKGIGLAIVKGIAKRFEGSVYLTARNETLGINALKELEKENIKNVKFHQLDITNQDSINQFAEHLKNKHKGLDVLVNNAAIAKHGDPNPIGVQASDLIKTNYTGQVNVCNALFPLLRDNSRVVHLAGRVGMLRFVRDENMRNKLKSDSLTVEELNGIMKTYEELAQTGKHKTIMISPYNFTKVGLIALTRVQQKNFDAVSKKNILVNAVCPGLVKTDMNPGGKLIPEQGAETPVFLALLSNQFSGPSGRIWADKVALDWTDMNWKWH